MNLIQVTKNLHVIISGGAGFIGGNLTARFLSEGASVTVLTRHPDSPRALHLQKLGATFIPWDCATSLPSIDIPGSPHHQIFLHLAADVSLGSPTLWQTNVEGTKRALELAKAIGSTLFVYASSIEAQGAGSDKEIPLTEDSPPCPLSDYGKSKREGERIVAEWANSLGMQALVLRIGNVYGPGSAWFLRASLMALIGASPMTEIWSVLKYRMFAPLYIDDLIEGISRSIQRSLTGTFNITGEEPVSIGTYMEKLASLTGFALSFPEIQEGEFRCGITNRFIDPDFAYVLMGKGDRCHRVYDNSKLRNEIGSYTNWSLVRGLASSLRWYYESGGIGVLLKQVPSLERDQLCMSH